jgi:serine/threonine protein kinase
VTDEDDGDIDSFLRGVAAAPELSPRAWAQSLVGALVGNYQVTALLGQGGMGAVYLGRHMLLERSAAIKILHHQLADDQEVVARFFNEARAVSAIKHENIVEVIDFGRCTDRFGRERVYILMELLEGESLRARLDRGRLSLDEILQISAQIARALAASHERGIVHRDLKPENVFLVAGGRVKLVDFGIAKLTKNESAWKTRTGQLLGTPLYMSPEQCMGRTLIDARSDVYSLGVVLYEMVSGRVPFVGDSFTTILRGHLMEPPAPLDGPLAATVARCLEKNPGARFSSMSELGAALISPKTQPHPKRSNRVFVFGAIVLSLLAAAAVTWWPRAKPAIAPPPPPAPVVVAPPPPPPVVVEPPPPAPPKPVKTRRPTAAKKAPDKPPPEKAPNEPLDDGLL